MASNQKPEFMTKWVNRSIRDARVWTEFKARVDEKAAARIRPDSTRCGRRYARWAALKAVAQLMPEARWKEGEEAWSNLLAHHRKVRATSRRKGIGVRTVKNRTALRLAIDREESEQRIRDRESRATRRREASERARNHRQRRKAEVRFKAQEKKIAKQEAYIKILEEKKKKLVREELFMKEERGAAAVTVVVQDQGPMDLIRDVKWVYENLADLVLVSESGVRRLDVNLLSKAPSNGAVAIAQYARDDPKAFLEKFVLRCMPKETAVSEVESDEDLEERLDPEFKGLAKYLGA